MNFSTHDRALGPGCRLTSEFVVSILLPMKTASVPISAARTNLCTLVKQVQSGVRVTLTSHGRPAADLVPVQAPPAPWRVECPDDPQRYGDLQSPVMEPWS